MKELTWFLLAIQKSLLRNLLRNSTPMPVVVSMKLKVYFVKYLTKIKIMISLQHKSKEKYCLRKKIVFSLSTVWSCFEKLQLKNKYFRTFSKRNHVAICNPALVKQNYDQKQNFDKSLTSIATNKSAASVFSQTAYTSRDWKNFTR